MIAGLEILNLHAQGGMAEVYRARGRGADGSDYHYAVKRILPEFTRDPEIKRMFFEESRIAACLVHSNIVRVYDLAQGEGDQYFIVMEFLEGKDLAEVIEKAAERKQTLPVWFAIQVAREVLRALTYVSCEARDREGRVLGLIHRDISPHNIFLCFDGQVKLTDFGVAKVQESKVKTQAGITKGKLGYMSPEQLMGQDLDARSDLYNVGILLFETLTGEPLFGGKTTAEFLQAMIKGAIPPLPPALAVPPELEALMRRALDRDRTLRPANAAAFEKALAEIAERYRLSAQTGHIAHQLTELFGPRSAVSEAASSSGEKQRLRSMMVAAPKASSQPSAHRSSQPQPRKQTPTPHRAPRDQLTSPPTSDSTRDQPATEPPSMEDADTLIGHRQKKPAGNEKGDKGRAVPLSGTLEDQAAAFDDEAGPTVAMPPQGKKPTRSPTMRPSDDPPSRKARDVHNEPGGDPDDGLTHVVETAPTRSPPKPGTVVGSRKVVPLDPLPDPQRRR